MTQIEQLISKIEVKKYNYKAMLKSAEPNSEDFYSCKARVALCEELLIAAKAILKKPEIKDLEKEIVDYEEYLGMYESSSRDDCIGIARHFAEFGARMQREQMMKDAIEGKVVAVRNTMSDKLHTYPWIELEAQLSKNDKVKVIIIKE